MKSKFTRELDPLKCALKDLEWVDEEGHDGPLSDLSVLLRKIGIDATIEDSITGNTTTTSDRDDD